MILASTVPLTQIHMRAVLGGLTTLNLPQARSDTVRNLLRTWFGSAFHAWQHVWQLLPGGIDCRYPLGYRLGLIKTLPRLHLLRR